MSDNDLLMDTDKATDEAATLQNQYNNLMDRLDGLTNKKNGVVLVHPIWFSDAAQAFDELYTKWEPEEKIRFEDLIKLKQDIEKERDDWIQKTKRR